MMIPNQSYCFSGIVVTLYLFFLFSFVLHTLASPTLHFCRHDQRDALLEFKHEFPVNYMSSWNKSSDCCSWEGVKCDAISGEVILFQLYNVPLNNSLKPNSGLFKLQYLQNLALSSCSLYGAIPSSLGNLSHLTDLDLSHNELVGKVPASIGNLTQLRYLSLSGNNLSGKIHVSFANLTKLVTLDLISNYFESELPPDMNGLRNLEDFWVCENSLSGPFPTTLFTIPLLKWVCLGVNQFKGTIEFGNTSSSSRLNHLSLDHNKFDGPIPESISKFLNLVSLDLSYNSFIGPIPKSISKFLNLASLDLSYNNFVGPIPRSISQLANLYSLDLSNNNLEGKIPGCLWRLTQLKLSHNSFSSFGKSSQVLDQAQMMVLGLNSNSFRGQFPLWICKLRWLELVNLSNNSFSGSIPPCLRNITKSLQVLILHSNNFSGILPDVFVNATTLKALDVSRNRFEGKLPKSLINCEAMKLLNVESNKFKDKFPSWLGSLQALNVLSLRSNQFYGSLYHNNESIGFQRLKVIDLSHNDFIGTFPAFYFSKWHEMSQMTESIELDDVDGVYMEDFVDSSVSFVTYRNSMEMVHKRVDTKFERIRKDFRAIDFSGNKFSGKIPESIGLLKELLLLNLSGNAFTSNIPQSLANLTKLEALDLSRNQLSGQIPRDLGALSFLSTMDFSHNNLEGPIPRGTQFQRQNCSSFMDNPRLYGLEEICGKTHASNPTSQESEEVSEPEEQVINWIAAVIAYGPGVFCGLVIGHIFVSHKHEWFMEKFRRNNLRVIIRSAR